MAPNSCHQVITITSQIWEATPNSRFTARKAILEHVPVVSSFHFLIGPIVAVSALGIIILICRWVFSTEHRDDRTSRRLEKILAHGDFGLLVPVATVRTRDDAEMLRDVLLSAGVRAGISGEADILEVMVFSKDLERARGLVSAR